MEDERLERHPPHPRRHRQGRPHVGRAQRRAAVPGRHRPDRTWPRWRKTADDQVGRVLDKLEEHGIADDTLVVLTTDHAQLNAENYFGVNEPGRGNLNWYYGSDEVTPARGLPLPSPEIKRLIDETDNVRAEHAGLRDPDLARPTRGRGRSGRLPM